MSFFQLPRTPINADGTISVYNYGSSDIAANLAVEVDTTNLPDPANGKHGYGVQLPASDGDFPFGVTVETIKAGGAGRVQVSGIIPCVASGTVTAGGSVMVEGTTGKVKTQSGSNSQLGQALTTAATGLQVAVKIEISINA